MKPPWGTFPAEEYLLQQWNFESEESPDEQRRRLIRAFIAAGPEETDYLESGSIAEAAPPDHIATILEPWRTRVQRTVANRGMVPSIWLRTCYSPGSDEKHEQLVANVELDHAVDGEHRLLNDANLYNFGADWRRIFDTIPELLDPSSGDWEYYQQRQNEGLNDLKSFARGGVSHAPSRLLENLACFQGKELEEWVAKALQSSVHEACVVAWIVLEDEEALESKQVLLMFLDAYGRVVREKRVGVDEAEDMGGSWVRGSWHERDEWLEAELGEDYRGEGVCGELLLENLRNVG